MLIAGIMIYDQRIFLNVVYPWFVIVASFIGSYLLRFILEQKGRKFIEGAFGHYVNKDVVDQIIKNPSMLELGGAKKEITIFFSDIEGFTSLSEKLEPSELVAFLNEYLREMTEIILKHEGTLDKYEGDAIMAFWNAPLPTQNHALKACESALDNQKKLAELRNKWRKEGKPDVAIRIGINTGAAVVGNMGSENRFDYTAMGDNVNLASRLEGINKEYRTGIVVSESTYEAVKDHLVCRELDLIRVKGKSVPVRIFELICRKQDETEEIRNRNIKFQDALLDYRSRNFESAKEKFSAIKNDPPSAVYVERCKAFINSVPPNNWDGVFTFTTK
jgi:adenylate cyclase